MHSKWQTSLALLLSLLTALCGCQMQCNSASRQKRIVISNPAQMAQNECRYTVQPASAFVCQVRIDFNRFELPQPSLNASTAQLGCTDYLRVNHLKICGRNAGQHLYVPLKRTSGGSNTLTLDFILTTRPSPQSTWQLTLTQLDCPATSGIRLPFLNMRTIFGAPPFVAPQPILPNLMPHSSDFDWLAPVGCDQYYREPQGNIRSFNYFDGSTKLPDLAYTICVKNVLQGEIEYKFEDFQMGYNTLPGYDEDCHATVHTTGRIEDYLLIPKSSLANNAALQPTYYCAAALHGVTIKAHPPFIMYYATDSHNVNANRFDLHYKVQALMGYA